jgi:hypothetical protein
MAQRKGSFWACRGVSVRIRENVTSNLRIHRTTAEFIRDHLEMSL